MLILEWIIRLWLALAIFAALAVGVVLFPIAWIAEQMLRLFARED